MKKEDNRPFTVDEIGNKHYEGDEIIMDKGSTHESKVIIHKINHGDIHHYVKTSSGTITWVANYRLKKQ